MTGYPALSLALLQGLIAAAIAGVLPLGLAFGGRLKIFASDLVLMVVALIVGAIVTTAAFFPFEGDWADSAFGPIVALRPMIVGGAWLVLGMVVTHWHGLLRMRFAEVAHRLGSVFAFGALWGVLWSLSGWVLDMIGMANNG
jgi:hypothetical protein